MVWGAFFDSGVWLSDQAPVRSFSSLPSYPFTVSIPNVDKSACGLKLPGSSENSRTPVGLSRPTTKCLFVQTNDPLFDTETVKTEFNPVSHALHNPLCAAKEPAKTILILRKGQAGWFDCHRIEQHFRNCETVRPNLNLGPVWQLQSGPTVTSRQARKCARQALELQLRQPSDTACRRCLSYHSRIHVEC